MNIFCVYIYVEKVNLLKHSRLLAPFAKIVIHFSANCKRSAFSISYHKFVEYNIKRNFYVIMTNILFKNIKWKMSKNENEREEGLLQKASMAFFLFFFLNQFILVEYIIQITNISKYTNPDTCIMHSGLKIEK